MSTPTSSSRPHPQQTPTHADETEPTDYSILATSSRADERTRVIKHGESFGVFDPSGTIRRGGVGELGIYHDGTRFLSGFELALCRRRPLLLGSTVRNDGVFSVHLASPDMPDFAGGPLEKDAIHIAITSFLWNAAWYARFEIHNYAQRPIEALDVALVFAADFVDVFEVRGMRRIRRGTQRAPIVEAGSVTLAYDGLDNRARYTHLRFDPPPAHLLGSRAELAIPIAAGASYTFEVSAAFSIDGLGEHQAFEAALAAMTRAKEATTAPAARIETSNERFDTWIDRSAADLAMMTSETQFGPYPYAGVPWFSTPFGRDGIITAFERLWLQPGLARGVLAYLAATQATEHDPERDAEPGKIIHEVRQGEMAALGEIPFGRYYGSVDSTPLFVMLAAAYWERTGDRATIEQLWPHVLRALAWLDEHGDVDADGFVEYASKTSRGLVSQGWKDSFDSVSHADGALAVGPVALCEVQGYAFAARRGAATLANVLGHTELCRRLTAVADGLQRRFERAFWSDALGTYVLALDGQKRPCEVAASNTGHLLWTGIASPARGAAIAQQLMAPGSFTGWGIRTLDASAARYNPISYHNGSIWPHDNALCAAGLARYGHKEACAKLLGALFEASHNFDFARMPELFCGFPRRESEGPTLYPVACSPQAWAAGAVFMLLQAALGITIDAPQRRILIDRPMLPPSLSLVAIRDLQVGDATVDFVCERQADDVAVHLERRRGDVTLALLK